MRNLWICSLLIWEGASLKPVWANKHQGWFMLCKGQNWPCFISEQCTHSLVDGLVDKAVWVSHFKCSVAITQFLYHVLKSWLGWGWSCKLCSMWHFMVSSSRQRCCRANSEPLISMPCLNLGPWYQFRSKQGVQAHLLSAGQSAAHLESAGQICSPPCQSHPG